MCNDLINNILKYKSISIIGTEKNTGKTETFNFCLKNLLKKSIKIAVTSIGVDGESVDIVTNTKKPEIELAENVIFVTSEKHFREKKISAEILNISKKSTSLGRLVTAKAHSCGKVILSGPSDTKWLKSVIDDMREMVDITLIDGALSRKSLASPTITDAMILNTGAALSANINTLIKETKFLCNLINIPIFENEKLRLKLQNFQENFNNSSIWAIDNYLNINDLQIKSPLLIENHKNQLSSEKILYINGIITNKILDFFRIQKNISERTIIVNDFTKIFVSPENLNYFEKAGGKIRVLNKTNLLAVCVNPTSPEGYILNTNELTKRMQEELGIDVYDTRNVGS